MIPKIIHYCWFGRNPLPEEFQSYINEWKRICPDFDIMCWDEKTFDVFNSIPFVQEAYQKQKYAFVADYVRMYAIYNYGGIYMDTDIKLLKRLDEFLTFGFFTAMEYHDDNVRLLNVESKLTPKGYRKNTNEFIYDICIESSIFGAQKEHPFVLDCLNYYQDKNFILPDGSLYDTIIVPVIMAVCAEKYGFRYVNEQQVLDGDMHLFPDDYFTHPKKATNNTYALHMVKNSWKKFSTKQKIYAALAQNSILKSIYNKLSNYSIFQLFFDNIQKKTWLQRN